MATQIDTARPPEEALLSVRRLMAWGLLWGGVMLALMLLWLGNKELSAPALFQGPLLLLALAGIAWSVRLLLRPASASATAAEFHKAVLVQRRLTGYALLGAAGLLLLLGLLLAWEQGLAAFAEVCGMILLAALAAGAAASQLRPPESTALQDQLLEALGEVLSRWVIGLAIIGVGLGLFAYRSRLSDALSISPEIIGLVLFGSACEFAALLVRREAPGRTRAQNLRLLVLLVGGSLGLTIAVVMILRLWEWWPQIFSAEVPLAQSEGLWRLWLCLYVELLGLALVFGSLMLARTDVRESPVMRRLLFGYNTVLSGIMVLAILFVGNVILGVTYPLNFVWSKGQGLHSLADSSKNLLDSLKDQVRIYALMSPSGRFHSEVQVLLDNLQSYSRMVRVDYVSPDKEGTRYLRLADKYPAVTREVRIVGQDEDEAGRGLLIVYGPDIGAKGPHAFVPIAELADRRFDKETRKEKVLFKGEDVVMTQIRLLVEREAKPKIYFTQGSGELKIVDAVPGALKSDIRGGAGLLLAQLKKDNYEVRGLVWRAAPEEKFPGMDLMAFAQKTAKDRPEVPADAKIVVLAAPLEEFPPDVFAALDRYAERGGKLIVLSNYVLRRGHEPLETGLEDFLKKFNVELGKDFLLRAPENLLKENPLVVLAQPPGDSRNKVAMSFRSSVFVLGGTLGVSQRDGIGLARSVRPMGTAGGFEAVPLLQVREERNGPVWAEKDLNTLKDPFRYLQRLEESRRLDSKKSPEAVPVAVAVSDRDKKPRLVVFGDARFASNRFVNSKMPYYDFLTSSIEWLVERPGNIGIKPKETDFFTLQPDKVNTARLVWLPLALLLLTLVGLGTGIWVIRRR